MADQDMAVPSVLVTPKEYADGHSVIITEEWQFVVNGPEFEHLPMGKRTFLSLTDARDAVRKALSDKEKIEAAKIELNLRVIDEAGSIRHVDKIDRRSGIIMGLDKAPS